MPATAAALDPEAFDYLCGFILRRSAIVVERAKAYLVESRLTPVARQHGFDSLGQLVSALQQRPQPALERQVVEAMTTNESSFFRDVHPFDALRTAVLPDLIARRQGARALNVWSGACSTGQELYSIALVLHEHFPALRAWNVRLVGTDLSSEVVARAREGAFNQVEVNRGLPIHLLLKYFRREGLQWRICDELRRGARFDVMNLVERFPGWLPKMDVVFLRNVLIYFSPETKRLVFAAVRQVLQPDGYLFLGGAETTLNLDDAFERVPIGKASCYRLRGAPPPTS